MKRIYFLLVAILVSPLFAGAQDPVAQKYGNSISEATLKEYLSILASDALEGRETGTRGQKMAAAFIAAHFQELGLQAPVNGSHFQPVPLYTSVPGDSYVKSGNAVFNSQKDLVHFGNESSNGEKSAQLVFAGYGEDADYANLAVKDVNGKAVLLMAKEQSFRAFITAINFAYGKGAAKVLLIPGTSEEDSREVVAQLRGYLSGGSMRLQKNEQTSAPEAFMLPASAGASLMNSTLENLKKAADGSAKGGLKKVKPVQMSYQVMSSEKMIMSENVLGFLEGTDKKDEVVVITAHYDHVGIGGNGADKINNGADDDGSGTSAVLQLAKAFAEAKKEGKGPRRSILFMLVTGEEKGLLGSEYYSENPVYPLNKTVVDLNIDMVGRRDPQHKDSAPYVYVIGSDKLSTELHNLNEQMNKTYTKLILDYTYNDQNHPDRLYYRSDHWNFAKKNIPIIFFFDGIHEDYHKPSDEVSKIEFDHLAKRTQLVFYTAWEIANREARIMPDKK